jgi:hypothetical protein
VVEDYAGRHYAVPHTALLTARDQPLKIPAYHIDALVRPLERWLDDETQDRAL